MKIFENPSIFGEDMDICSLLFDPPCKHSHSYIPIPLNTVFESTVNYILLIDVRSYPDIEPTAKVCREAYGGSAVTPPVSAVAFGRCRRRCCDADDIGDSAVAAKSDIRSPSRTAAGEQTFCSLFSVEHSSTELRSPTNQLPFMRADKRLAC